jgi:hypothetical protein
MDWMFLGITAGALAYGVIIFREFREARVRVNAKLDAIAVEEKEVQEGIQKNEEEARTVTQKADETRKAVAEFQTLAKEKEAAVRGIREEKESRGKFRLE